MTVYVLDPIIDTRWAEFVKRHDSASVFHSVPWLDAIRRTYGYKPVVYTTSPPGSPLSNGIVLCQVNSWLTGRRMVSVPFSDHCEPLLDSASATAEIAETLKKSVDTGKWKYIELRPASEPPVLDGIIKAPAAYLHMLDLSPSADELLRRTDKTSIQQRIRRIEREGIEFERGNSAHLLNAFYRLLVQTRRRHKLPPQPIQWFRNLAACMGDCLQIHVAFKDGQEIASILTLQHKDVLVYKYGCSDTRFKNLGATPSLLWKAITKAQADGMKRMDFGRSDADNPGLITFKNGWGAKSSQLIYLRWCKKPSPAAAQEHSSRFARYLFAMMPDSLLEATGRILYRHIG